MSATSLTLTVPLGLFVPMFEPVVATPEALAATAYIALFPTVLGFWLWYSGASRMSGGEASVFMAVLPVSALLLSYVFLGEKLSVIHFMGIALVILGIVNTTLPTRQPAYKD